MIFFKALKYKILDLALGILFDNLQYNFSNNNRTSIRKLKNGMCIRRINYLGNSYFNCKVDDFHEDSADEGWYLYIFFEDSDIDNEYIKDDKYVGFWIEHKEEDLMEIYV